jgi:ABC-2 type transport system ATP-binding protein
VIRIEGLTKTFRRHNVLDGLTLSIEEGDRVALVGANGAGKTTLIRCLLGEYTYEGMLSVDGRSPRRQRCEVLAGIGFVPQLPPPLKMPVGDLVRYAASVSATERQSIIDVLAQLGLDLDQVASKPFVKLSGGQKQKILAAIALGRDCRLLILDEPTANLDPAARRVLFDLLAARPERPMLISSHRLEEVVGLVNRVIELDRGQVVLDERIAATGSLAARHACRIVASRAEPAFAAAMRAWGLTASDNGLGWQGSIAAADRLRFLAVLTRFGGLIASLHIDGETARAAANGTSIVMDREGDHAARDAS